MPMLYLIFFYFLVPNLALALALALEMVLEKCTTKVTPKIFPWKLLDYGLHIWLGGKLMLFDTCLRTKNLVKRTVWNMFVWIVKLGSLTCDCVIGWIENFEHVWWVALAWLNPSQIYMHSGLKFHKNKKRKKEKKKKKVIHVFLHESKTKFGNVLSWLDKKLKFGIVELWSLISLPTE